MTDQCENWQAWLNTMPPKPDTFHVVGDVLVPNPGVSATLTMRAPQGINPATLALDLHLVQLPGNWPQIMTCASARFDRILPEDATRYDSVDIFLNGNRIETIADIFVVS